MRGLPVLSVAVVILCGVPAHPETGLLPARAEEVPADLPPLCLVDGLPSLKHCQDYYQLAQHWVWEAQKLPLDKNGWPPAEVFYASKASWAWHYAYEVRDVKLDPLWRRRQLKKLIDWVGWEAVIRGQLPPPVHFPRGND